MFLAILKYKTLKLMQTFITMQISVISLAHKLLILSSPSPKKWSNNIVLKDKVIQDRALF